MPDQHIFKVVFYNQGQIYEVYARSVAQGGLFGFIEIEELVFGTRTQVVVDPSEETLKREFEGVKRTYLPLHSIVRIDEVEREGAPRIHSQSGDGKVTPFPLPIYGPAPPKK